MSTRHVFGRVSVHNIAAATLLLLAMGFVLLPLSWAISTSLKTATEVTSWPPRWVPERFIFDNYLSVISNPKLILYFRNTIIVIVGATALSLAVSVHAAYAVARYRFVGRGLFLLAMWSTIMIPAISLLVSLYLMAVATGIYDSFFVLIIVYSSWSVPTLVWLLRGFVQRIPSELEEAARVDGCTRTGSFYRITLPLLRPGLFAGAVLVFVNVWNEFLIGYALVISDSHRIIQVGLYSFVTEAGVEWGPLMTVLVLSLVPVSVLFAVFQKVFIRGMVGGSVKG